MPDLFDRREVSLRDQLRAAERELAYRRRVYPRWVDAGKLDNAKAQHEIAAMTAIVKTLMNCIERERVP